MPGGRLVLRRPEAVQAVPELAAAGVQDLGEAHDRHGVVAFDPAAVDLLEEVHGLVEAAEWIPLDEAPDRLAYDGERKMAQAALSALGR